MFKVYSSEAGNYSMSLSQQRQKELYDKNKSGSPLKFGDKVWLHSTVVP